MKLRYIIPILAFSVTAVSCDFLNLSDPNAQTVGNFYQTEDDIASVCAGIYQPVRITLPTVMLVCSCSWIQVFPAEKTMHSAHTP